MLVKYYAYNIPGSKVYIEPPRLVVKEVGGKQFYWNFFTQRWTRMTKRCPYLN